MGSRGTSWWSLRHGRSRAAYALALRAGHALASALPTRRAAGATRRLAGLPGLLCATFLRASLLRAALLCAALLGATLAGPADAQSGEVSLTAIAPDAPLGLYTQVLVEDGPALDINEAMAAAAAGRYGPARQAIPSFGLGARPVWLRLKVRNSAGAEVGRDSARRLVIENAWLDSVDVYYVQGGRVVLQAHLGDTLPYAQRPVRMRFFGVDHTFAEGVTEIYLRAATPDPLVLPLYLMTRPEAGQRGQAQGYTYGLLYGYLLALLAYNAILYLNLRDKRQLSYSVFLFLFIAVNVAYTGHGYAWLWPESVTAQRWVIPILAVLYSASGLLFARYFLDLPARLPRAYRFVQRMAAAFLLLLALSVLAPDQTWALVVAFTAVVLFALALPLLGMQAARAGLAYSRYFLPATLASMLGIAVTAACVLGLIGYTEARFHAAEIGMLADATFLALALGNQLRTMRTDQLQAEERASRDPLTELRNRRAFLEAGEKIWANGRRRGGDLSVIMLDLDHFKSINDFHGHAAGDCALVAAARVLAGAVRDGDLVARWGGEEFMLLLPETRPEAALALAERLRRALAAMRVRIGEAELSVTGSFGVAHRGAHESLERLISQADKHLYQAKRDGRDCVREMLRDTTPMQQAA